MKKRVLRLITYAGIFHCFVPLSSGLSLPKVPKESRLIKYKTKPASTSKSKQPPFSGEGSRKFRRTHYTHENWPYHRSPDRIFRNLASMPFSGIASQLFKEVGLVMTVAAAIIFWNCALAVGWTDMDGFFHEGIMKGGVPILKLPQTPFTLVSPALGLLLVFKTNNAYDRWWEARKLWGDIENHTRNICRMSSGYASDETLQRLSLAVWAFPRSLTCHLHGIEDEVAFNADVRKKLDSKFAEALVEARHKPTRVLFEITRCLKDLPLNDFVRMEVDKSATALCDAVGACERIYSTPIPLVYSRHTARFLTVWLLFLPFCLYQPFANTWNHIGMLPATLLISFFLFGIEELAVQIEEPFSILPLHTMTSNIELSCKEYVEWRDELPDSEKVHSKPTDLTEVVNAKPEKKSPN